VQFDVPVRGLRRQRGEEVAAEAQHGLKALALCDVVADRFEPAFDVALQRVVIQALVMRLMRPAFDGAIAQRMKDRMAAAAMAADLGQINVRREVVPTVGEGVPVLQRAVLKQMAPHFRASDEAEALLAQGVRELIVIGRRGRGHAGLGRGKEVRWNSIRRFARPARRDRRVCCRAS